MKRRREQYTPSELKVEYVDSRWVKPLVPSGFSTFSAEITEALWRWVPEKDRTHLKLVSKWFYNVYWDNKECITLTCDKSKAKRLLDLCRFSGSPKEAPVFPFLKRLNLLAVDENSIDDVMETLLVNTNWVHLAYFGKLTSSLIRKYLAPLKLTHVAVSALQEFY